MCATFCVRLMVLDGINIITSTDGRDGVGFVIWTLRVSNPSGGKRFSLLCACQDRRLGLTQPPVQWRKASFAEVKRLGRGADHSPSSDTEGRTEWSCNFVTS